MVQSFVCILLITSLVIGQNKTDENKLIVFCKGYKPTNTIVSKQRHLDNIEATCYVVFVTSKTAPELYNSYASILFKKRCNYPKHITPVLEYDNGIGAYYLIAMTEKPKNFFIGIGKDYQTAEKNAKDNIIRKYGLGIKYTIIEKENVYSPMNRLDEY